MKKRLVTMLVLLAAVLILVQLPMRVNAAEITESGTWGDNITWELDDTGTLTISGQGEMKNLSSYKQDAWLTHWGKINRVVVEAGITRIGAWAFYNCTKVTEFDLPDSLTQIGREAFRNCASLTQIRLPDGVTGESLYWFQDCAKLTDVQLPEQLVSLSSTFLNCTALETITIPKNVGYIGTGTFDGCKNLTQIQVDPENTHFRGDGCILFNKSGSTLVMASPALSGSYTVPDAVNILQTGSFRGCDQLEQVQLPKGLSVISNSAFEDCVKLERVEIPGSVQIVGPAAFKNCKALTEVILPARLEALNEELFSGCAAMERLVIPENVMFIEPDVFYGMYQLRQVFFLGNEPGITEDTLFYGKYVESYQPVTVYHLETATGWTESTWAGADVALWSYTLSGTASCSQPGVQIFTDAEHELVYEREVSWTTHFWQEPVVGRSPTADSEGYWVKTCSSCGTFEVTATIPKLVATQQTPAKSDNQLDQNYTAYASVMNGYLVPSADGGWCRVEYANSSDGYVTVEYYDKDFRFLSSKGIALELPIFGGFYTDGKYNYLVMGQENPNEDNNQEVIRVVQYTLNWERRASDCIKGGHTTIPFRAGSLRMHHSGDMLYIRSCHQMYTSSNDGLRHQANLTLTVHTPTMELTTQELSVANNPSGYVSHSFNQFILTDGKDLVAVDHGDGYPRAIVIHRNRGIAGSYRTTGTCQEVNILEIWGETGLNATGASVGGFQVSQNAYLVAGNSIDQESQADYNGPRNIFVSATDKNNFTAEGTRVTWLTNYHEDGAWVSVSTPQLVKVGEDRFLVMWMEMREQLKIAYVDGNGKWDGQVYTVDGRLSDCQPVVRNGRVVWYATGAVNADFSYQVNASEPEFYEIDLNDPTTVIVHHNYEPQVLTKPTQQQTGSFCQLCAYCGDRIVRELPALSDAAYTLEVTKEATCKDHGTATYTWKNTQYGTVSWEEVLLAKGHVWKYPTCTEPMTCEVCGETYGSANGHKWSGGGDCTTPKICSVCGAAQVVGHTYGHEYDYKCDVCGATRVVDMTRPMVDMFRMYDPNSGEHFYTGSEEEKNNLIAAGWNYEGVGFTFPLTTGKPVHRLYDPVYGEHLYTMDENEMNALLAAGWNYEGIAFNSGFENEVPQYRLHNPNATRGAYHFTASEEEKNNLIAAGWEYQGIGWYSLGA